MSRTEPVIRGCEFKFRCKKTWESLESLENYPNDVKYCSACQRDVFLVETDLDVKRAVLNNQCVAIPQKMRISVIEETAFKHLKEGHIVGHVCPSENNKSPLKGIWP
ncbi:hypothetical protein [Polynucleobacter nymphae]|uniref:hypothetical protein n=1 Tax=Polynucleobacter nymphae TaxID=2081043 RepID=UPI001C0D79A1|nr:hypothetical protein [Polynucleobacter nymphae]MBU3606870.1 hypothetical protein [Polynucleobacter nymphae]